MPFKRYVEVGRLARVNYGPSFGELVIISDVVDENRVLVDSPTFVRRQIINLKRLSLTDFCLDITRLFSKKKLKEALESNDVFTKFKESVAGKRTAKKKLIAGMSDFERFNAQRKRAATLKKIREIMEKGQAQ